MPLNLGVVAADFLYKSELELCLNISGQELPKPALKNTISLPMCTYHKNALPMHLHMHLPMNLLMNLPMNLLMNLPMHLPMNLPMHLPMNLPMHLPIHLCTYHQNGVDSFSDG